MGADIRWSKIRVHKERCLALSSHPGELETIISIADGRIFQLCPARSEHIDALRKLFAELSHHEIRMRFLHAMYKVPDRQVSDFFHMDDQWAMSFVLVESGACKEREAFGYVQIIPDPDEQRGEFAILVRADLTRMGIGRALLEHLIAYARKRGLREIYGYAPVENIAMLALVKALRFGFSESGDPESVLMTMKL